MTESIDRRSAVATTSLGDLTLVAEGDRLAGVYFPHHWHRPAPSALGRSVPLASDDLLTRVAAQLQEYLAGERRTFDVPVLLRGDAFEEQVWSLLTGIPFGTTTTYGALAVRLGDRTLAQQVGQAVGRNPVSIVMPCHRVVGQGGKLVGYAGGLARKQSLLELEDPAGGVALLSAVHVA